MLSAGALALLSGVAMLLTAGGATSAASAEEDLDQVVVCKYSHTPETGEVAQTVIIVDTSSLLDEGFAGTFPFDFSDEHESSFAIRYAEVGETTGSLDKETDCPTYPPTSEPPTSEPPSSEPPTSEPPTSEPPTETPTETTSESPIVLPTEAETSEAPTGLPSEAETTPVDEVLGTSSASPAAGGGAQALPTVVDAGLVGDTAASSSLQATFGTSLMGVGLVLLLAAGWIGLGQRARGAHEI